MGMELDNISNIDLVETNPILEGCNPAGISVLLGGYAFTWNPTFLGRSVFCLVGRKSRLDHWPEDGVGAPLRDLHVLHGSITILAYLRESQVTSTVDVIYAHLVGLGNLNKHVFSCRILVLVWMPKGEQLFLNHTGS